MKQVLDVDQIKSDKEGRVLTEGVPLKLSNYDKNAVEQAVRLKEKNPGTEVVAIATGPNIREGVKEVLAMGCEKAFVVNSAEFKGSDNLATSRVLAKAIQKVGGVDLVLLGEGSLDSYSSLLGPRLSERLAWPVVSYAIALEVSGGAAKVTSNLGGIHESFEVPLPLVVTVSEEMNQPRLPPLLQILQAGKKPITEWKLADLGLGPNDVGEGGSGLKLVEVKAPKMQRKNIRFRGSPEEAAAQLAQALRKEGLV